MLRENSPSSEPPLSVKASFLAGVLHGEALGNVKINFLTAGGSYWQPAESKYNGGRYLSGQEVRVPSKSTCTEHNDFFFLFPRIKA